MIVCSGNGHAFRWPAALSEPPVGALCICGLTYWRDRRAGAASGRCRDCGEPIDSHVIDGSGWAVACPVAKAGRKK